jgi:hypothetical protein
VVGVGVDLVVLEVVQSDEFYKLIRRFYGDNNRSIKLLLVRVEELLHVVALASELIFLQRFYESVKVVR